MGQSSLMLDADLANLYGVSTKALVQAAKRNAERSPADFMFQLTEREAVRLRSQSVISRPARGCRRAAPFVFTEHGVEMLSSVPQPAGDPGERRDHARVRSPPADARVSPSSRKS